MITYNKKNELEFTVSDLFRVDTYGESYRKKILTIFSNLLSIDKEYEISITLAKFEKQYYAPCIFIETSFNSDTCLLDFKSKLALENNERDEFNLVNETYRKTENSEEFIIVCEKKYDNRDQALEKRDAIISCFANSDSEIDSILGDHNIYQWKYLIPSIDINVSPYLDLKTACSIDEISDSFKSTEFHCYYEDDEVEEIYELKLGIGQLRYNKYHVLCKDFGFSYSSDDWVLMHQKLVHYHSHATYDEALNFRNKILESISCENRINLAYWTELPPKNWKYEIKTITSQINE